MNNFEKWLQEEHHDIYLIYTSYIEKYNEYKKSNKNKERTTTRHRKISEEDITSAISLYKDENISIKEIAETLGVSYSTIHKCFKERGVERNKKEKTNISFASRYPITYKNTLERKKLINKDSLKEAKLHYQRWDQYQVKKLEILYKSGMNIKDIARIMGRSLNSINNTIEREKFNRK